MQPLCPKGGNDKVYTPSTLSSLIVNHFNPSGKIVEPCRGKGSFSSLMPGCDWFEIDDGKDFLLAEGHWDWAVTNPPWSQFRPFLKKSMEVADNVVFLALLNAWFMKARMRDMKEAEFGIAEILLVDTPSKPWPQTGFQLADVHIKRGYRGDIKLTEGKLAKAA